MLAYSRPKHFQQIQKGSYLRQAEVYIPLQLNPYHAIKTILQKHITGTVYSWDLYIIIPVVPMTAM